MFDNSMSESSSLLFSFPNNFRFLLIFLSHVFLSHEDDHLILHSKSPVLHSKLKFDLQRENINQSFHALSHVI